jgi:hypothetical protein
MQLIKQAATPEPEYLKPSAATGVQFCHGGEPMSAVL